MTVSVLPLHLPRDCSQGGLGPDLIFSLPISILFVLHVAIVFFLLT